LFAGFTSVRKKKLFPSSGHPYPRQLFPSLRKAVSAASASVGENNPSAIAPRREKDRPLYDE
jgi:hypothetical protein